MPDLGRLNKFMSEYLPMMLKEEQQKREVMRWLQKSLQETAAYGEEQRKTIDASTRSQILQALADPRFFEGKQSPELAILSHLSKIMPGELGGVNVPADLDPRISAAQSALANMSKYTVSGEQPPEDVLGAASQNLDPKLIQQFLSDIIAKQEGAAERGVREKAITAQGAETEVRKGELRAREKEIGAEGGKGKKTQKELEDDLKKAEDERVKEIQKLTGISTGTGRPGKPLGEQQQSILAKIAKIDREIQGFEGKLGVKVLATKADMEEFVRRAQATIAAGKKVNWQEAMIQGFDPAWVLDVRAKLEVKKK